MALLMFVFNNFYPDIRLVEVLFNFVNTAAHCEFLLRACAYVNVKALGYLPGNPAFAIPSRYLGLSIDAKIQYGVIAEALADALPATVDLDRLLAVTRTAAPVPRAPTPSATRGPRPRRIAVASDEVSIFTYRQNLAFMVMMGTRPCTTSLANARVTLGYRAAEWSNLIIKEHELHCSVSNDHGLTPTTARITSAKGAPVPA